MVAQPAADAFVTSVTVKVKIVSVSFRAMEMSNKVRISTLLAMAAVTFPLEVDAQMALHAATLQPSNEKPATGIAT